MDFFLGDCFLLAHPVKVSKSNKRCVQFQAVLLLRPFLGFKTKTETLAIRSRDRDRDRDLDRINSSALSRVSRPWSRDHNTGCISS